MQQKISDPRIDKMFGTDRLWAYGAVLVLWLLYAFVFLEVMPNVVDSMTLIVLAIGGGLVLLFNTASILAMISHYGEDKENIYGLDLHYLDLMKKP
ncbi:MAG: hypothetical protein R3D57_20130 [Hyphomicrobiaceae bacterium]